MVVLARYKHIQALHSQNPVNETDLLPCGASPPPPSLDNGTMDKPKAKNIFFENKQEDRAAQEDTEQDI